MVFYSWKLTLVAIFIAVVMTLSTLVFQPTLQQKTRELLVQEAETQGVLVETFKGALTLKTTTSGSQFWDELQSRFSRLANLTFRTIQIGIINNTFSGFISGIGGVILLWFGGNLVINPAENLSIGQLLAFNSMNGNFLGLIGTVISFVEEFTRAKTATQRLTEVIDATSENEGDEIKPFAKIAGNADIICTNVNFHYAGRLDLLEDFSLTIPGGKVIALIGKSGCGKSTLAKLIAGLYPLQSGNIRIGLYNLQDLSLECLRQQVVLVPQDAHFWSRSIVENFRLGAPYVTFEQIVRACQVADADEFISKLPDKYQTILGEFGANISGGQRQRLAIARAIVTDPPILILDESTGGLDPVSEAQVLDQLFKHRQGKTTILITHRPKVINRADWIVLLDQGKLKTQGSLEDLRYQIRRPFRFFNSLIIQIYFDQLCFTLIIKNFCHQSKMIDFLPPMSRWTSLAGTFLVGTVGAGITLSSWVKYNVTVKAAATVRPIGETRLVQPKIEGTVKSILVKENQTCQTGRCDCSSRYEQLQIKKSQLQDNIQQSRLQIIQIYAQIRTLNTQIIAEARVSRTNCCFC